MLDNKENDLNNMSQHSVLNAFDFTAIDEMDPSLGKFASSTALYDKYRSFSVDSIYIYIMK
jgi:hypothetical protein